MLPNPFYWNIIYFYSVHNVTVGERDKKTNLHLVFQLINSVLKNLFNS